MDKKSSTKASSTGRKTSTPVTIFAFALLALATSYYFFRPSWSHGSIRRFGSDDSFEDDEQIQDPPLPLDPYHPYNMETSTDRTSFGDLFTGVRCWPSQGGIVSHSCSVFEINFLELDPLNPSPSQRDSDPDEEDRFCKRLRLIGGRYFATESAHNYYSLTARGKDRWDLWLGWPGEKGKEGKQGVWVLWLDSTDATWKGVGRIRNMLTMEDRCKAIEMLGGKFHKDYRDVEQLRDLDLTW